MDAVDTRFAHSGMGQGLAKKKAEPVGVHAASGRATQVGRGDDHAHAKLNERGDGAEGLLAKNDVGTSFAAPIVAGVLAGAVLAGWAPGQAVARASDDPGLLRLPAWARSSMSAPIRRHVQPYG